MALTAATAFEAGRGGRSASVLVVDHGLHDDSAAVAARVAERLRQFEVFAGLDEVAVVRVEVGGPGGLEAAARRARYAALAEAADRDDAVVLLGHTLDDQAETVLLGLARGSGPRSMAGMRPVTGVFRRPLLGLSRSVARQACSALGLPVWEDPANADHRFARVRVRRDVLPVLEAELGPGFAEALARTAALAAEDVDALDGQAEALAQATVTGWMSADAHAPPSGPATPLQVDLTRLANVSPALRRRVLRLAALAAGCPGGDLSAVHIAALDALVTEWHGQRGVDLPGPVTAVRRGATLELTPGEPVDRAQSGRLPTDAHRPAH